LILCLTVPRFSKQPLHDDDGRRSQSGGAINEVRRILPERPPIDRGVDHAVDNSISRFTCRGKTFIISASNMAIGGRKV
jgi:hypothetical protein